MKKAIHSLLIGLLLVGGLSFLSLAQQRRTGANFDLATIAATPQKVTLSFRSFRGMPASYSLEKYCPTPGNQGNHGTCVAFANGYGIATLLYAKAHNLTNKEVIDKYIFSPTFLYEQIKKAEDKDCQEGTDPIKALVAMIEKGSALMKTVPYQCGLPITDIASDEARKYRIKDAALLFASGIKEYDRTPQERIDLTKKALLEGCPISTGFHLPETFFNIKSDIWTPNPNEVSGNWKHNGHAMAIVGYDDNKAGGAFRVLNSWGAKWADNGYVWIRYADYAQWCIMALQVFGNNDSPVPDEVKPAPSPKPTPAPESFFALSGSLEFKLNTGADMPVGKTSTRNLTVEEEVQGPKEDLVAYRMTNAYASGTSFRFYMNIDSEAYVYAFSTDLTGKVNRILPYDDRTSTHVGSNSVIAFPSDTKVIRLDDYKGTDYLLILYSAQKLDAQAIAQQMNEMTGALSTKIKTVLGNKLIDKSKITYSPNQVGFSTKVSTTRNLYVGEDGPTVTSGSVVPLMVEIKHN